jgi:hypothetical protein
MSKNELQVLPVEVADLKMEVDQWREARGKLGPMPEELWACATELARRYGVRVVSLPLGLDASRLKKRVVESGREARVPLEEKILATPFIELTCPPPMAVPRHVVEMERRDGGRMTIRLEAAGAAELEVLTRLFWSSGR